jgi:methylglutamate dehydrogenase subunit D
LIPKEGANVASYALIADPFLGGYSHDFGGVELAEVTDISLMSIAQPLLGRDALETVVKAVFGCALPTPGRATVSADDKTRLLCLGADSFMAITTGPVPVVKLAERLGDDGYYTDQSDNWVSLRLTGPLGLQALERLCPIDLHLDVFAVNSYARTSMDHLGTIILRQGREDFLLMSASSSAKSFLQAITTSIDNIQ